jgi:hypothetical protein
LSLISLHCITCRIKNPWGFRPLRPFIPAIF